MNVIKCVLGIILISLVSLFVIAIVWDWGRFNAVYEADNDAELRIACDEYKMSSIDSIPQKCYPYLVPLNVKELTK